ncbi:MAG: C40 family peptidase [Burkholderiaceae bacterium]|jgi:cell wall-associated NlpC family hydrolase|nr:C40 family peptidase [Burkholderiaceae bacterium]
MTGKKAALIQSIILSISLAIVLAGASSSSWSAETCESHSASSSPFDNYAEHATEIAMQAMSVIDAEYRFGGDVPQTGMDCSGLVRYAYRQVWGAELPRTSAAISKVGEKIKVSQLQPGDLVFYNTRKRRFSHVGIYLGDNKFVHAPSRGGKVRVEDMGGSYWQARFNGARRIADPRMEKERTEDRIRALHGEGRPKSLARSH